VVNNSEKIVEKLEQIEQRLSRLESSQKIEDVVNVEKTKAVVEDNRIGSPVWSIIALIIGGLILFYSVPSFLSRYFSSVSRYGYSDGYFDFGGILFIIVGALFVTLGMKGISKYRSIQSGVKSTTGEKSSTILFTQQNTSSINIKPEEKLNIGEVEEKKTKHEDSLEVQIASHWFSIVGIIAILLGVVFFLKYAFDNDWIGPVGQVSLGIIFGMALLGAGEYFRTKYAKYSQIITGGGLGVLYLSMWAAFGVFHLVDGYTLLFGMSLVTLSATLLAVRYRAISISVIGVVGGFMTPTLLSSGFDNQILLLTYVVILNLGVLFVALFKNWRILNILSFAGTYFVFTIWYGSHYNPTLFLTTLVFLTILFVIFSLVWVVYNLIYQKALEEQDILLMVLNAIVYFGFSYLLLSKNYADYLGFFAFSLSVYYFIFGYIAYTKFKAESVLTLGLLGISIIFLTVAVPFQVKKNLITLIWTTEAAVILWLGFWLSSYKLRVAALGIYILVVIRLVFFDSVIPFTDFQLLFNRRFFTYIAAAISAGIASWLYFSNKGKANKDENIVMPVLLIGLNVILVAAFTLESFSFFDSEISNLQKKLYKSEAPTAVLGQQTIIKAIESPMDDTSLVCNGLSNEGMFLGVDNYCNPPAKITTKLLFTNLTIPQNAMIVSAYVTVIPLDSSQENNEYAIVLKNGTLGQNGLDSPTVVWQTLPWKVDVALTTSNIASSLQGVVYDSRWQQGNSLLVMIEPVTTVSKKSYRISTFDPSPQNAAKLTITYSTPDTGGVQAQPYNPNNNQYNYPNNLNQRVPYQKPYVAPQIDVKVQAEIKTLTQARNFSISIIWLLYSLTLLIVGVLTKYKPIRLSALAFFAVTILKVFLVDSSNLAQIFRIVAFIGLGIILLVVAYIYQRYKQQINAFLLNG